MGKHATSALTQTVAIEGLADSYSAFNLNYHDTGLFGVYGVTDRDRCEDFAWAVLHALTKLVYEVGEDDVARAKNALKASLLFGQDSTQRECHGWGWGFGGQVGGGQGNEAMLLHSTQRECGAGRWGGGEVSSDNPLACEERGAWCASLCWRSRSPCV